MQWIQRSKELPIAGSTSKAHPHRVLDKFAVVILAASLLTGAVTRLPTQSAFAQGAPSSTGLPSLRAFFPTRAAASQVGPATPPNGQYTADGSVCRWSTAAVCDAGCGGGPGEALIKPTAAAADAIVQELVGKSPTFDPDNDLVATVDGTNVRLWRAADGEPTDELAGDALVFSPDGHSLALRQADGWHLWDIAAKQEMFRLPDRDVSLYFAADGRIIVAEARTSVTYDTNVTHDAVYVGSVSLYDAETGDALLTVPGIAFPTAISSNGALLATTMLKDGGALQFESIALWDTATGRKVHEMQAEIQSLVPLAGIRGHLQVNSLAFSPDGRTLLSAGADAVRLWDTASGEHLRCFQTPALIGADQAFWGPERGTIVGTAAGTVECNCGLRHEQEIYIWNAGTSWPVGVLGLGTEPQRRPLALALSAESDTLLVWQPSVDSSTGEHKAYLHKAYLWDLSSRRLLSVLPAAGLVTSAALSPAGDRAVTVSVYTAGNHAGAGASEDVKPFIEETLLWGTNSDGLVTIAEAQESYWNVLKAAADGKSGKVQERLLRKAQSLSPELFGAVQQTAEDDVKAFSAYLARKSEIEALAHDVAAAAAFAAAIRNTDPLWMELPDTELTQQVFDYIGPAWKPSSPAELARLVAAYQQLAALAPDIAVKPPIVYALVSVLAPGAAVLAQGGDTVGAAKLRQQALAEYPDLAIVFENAARYIGVHCALGLRIPDHSNPHGYGSLFCEDAAVDVSAIAFEETRSGSLAAGVNDFWSFQATTGTNVMIDLAADNSALDAYLYLYGPDGTLIRESNDFYGHDAHLEVQLPHAGRYLIVAAGNDGSGGDYQLRLLDLDTGAG